VFNKKFSSTGRSISVDLTTTANNNTGNNTHSANNIYFLETPSMDSLLQNSTLDKNIYRISTNILYTEPLAQNHFLQLSYNISDNISKSDKKTYDVENQGSILDSALSNVFENKYWTHRAGATYGYQTKEMRLSLGLSFNLNKLDNSQDFPYNSNMNRSFKDFLPIATFRYNITQQQNLQFFYFSQANIPTIDQLQNVLDNSNQLQLSIGNPNLKEQISHSINLRYSSVSSDFTDTYFFMVSTRLSKDYIGKSTILAYKDTTVLNNITLNTGTQLTYPTNLNGYLNLNCFTNYGTSMPIIHSSINFHAMLSYSKTPNINNNITNFSYSKSASLGTTISSNMSEDFDFTITSNYSYNNISSSYSSSGNTDYYNFYTRLRLNYTFLNSFVFQTNGNYQHYNSISDNYNPNNLLVTVSLAKKFLSNNQAEIKFTIFDLFNRNIGIQKNSTEFYVEDVTTNVLKRYYMLTFTYNLRAFGS
jgi:hypothetical protein